MKKLAALLLSACLMASLAACGTSGNSSPAPSGRETVSSQTSSTAKKGYTITRQGVTSAEVTNIVRSNEKRTSIDPREGTNFPKPDQIVYYTPGKTIAFEKDTEEYEKVFSLNQARCTGKMGMFQSILNDNDWKKLFEIESILEYQYDTTYYSLFFNLTVSPNDSATQSSFYWISTQMPNGHLYLFGSPSESAELLAYLKSLE